VDSLHKSPHWFALEFLFIFYFLFFISCLNFMCFLENLH
jgi:hypothetical protein